MAIKTLLGASVASIPGDVKIGVLASSTRQRFFESQSHTYSVLVHAHPQNGTPITFLDDSGVTDTGHDGLYRPVQLRHLHNDNSLIVGLGQDCDWMNHRLSEDKLHDATNSEDYEYNKYPENMIIVAGARTSQP